jgi:predicted enzyme related to lactoylglutathione lyase
MAITQLRIVGIIVRDQEEALRFYTEKLGFEKRTDQMFGPGMRWLTVAPRDQKEIEITLMLPNPAMHGEEGAKALWEQVGKSPTWSYSADDCRKTYEELVAKGVKFQSPPTEQFYGIEAVCEDLYGNTISIVEPSAEMRAQMEGR